MFSLKKRRLGRGVSHSLKGLLYEKQNRNLFPLEMKNENPQVKAKRCGEMFSPK